MLIFRLTNGQLCLQDALESTRGYRATIKSLKPCPKRYLLMQLARVALRRVSLKPCPKRYLLIQLARVALRRVVPVPHINACTGGGEESATTYRGVANFRACVLVYARKKVRYTPRILHFNAFQFVDRRSSTVFQQYKLYRSSG